MGLFGNLFGEEKNPERSTSGYLMGDRQSHAAVMDTIRSTSEHARRLGAMSVISPLWLLKWDHEEEWPEWLQEFLESVSLENEASIGEDK